MSSRRNKPAIVLISTILVLAAILVIWQLKIFGKPAGIPPDDYSYAVEFAEHRIQQVMKQQHLPSMAVVLIDDQETVWLDAFGKANLERNVPAESNTVYKLWSVAKVFTALETMRLVEEGWLDLDTPITGYLPDFSIQSRFPDSEPVTIRRILTHRSGLPRNGCNRLDFSPEVLPELVASLEGCYLAYPSDYRYKYSNIGFDTLGYIIQEMRGELFPDYMRENLLLPMGMNSSAFIRSQIPAQTEISPGYEYYEGEYYPYEQNDIANIPSGNLYSTIEDMGQFVKFIFRSGETGGKQLIDPENLESMFVDRVSTAKDPQPMGLGWKTATVFGSERLVWHDGGPSEGTGALVAMLPERKLGVVLIANGITFEGSVSVALALDLFEVMLETKYGLTEPQDEKPQAAAGGDPAVLEKYAGRYIAFGAVMEVFLRGDQLKGKIQGFTFDLDPLSETTFQPRHWLADIGLASLLGVPIDLRQLKIEFMVEDITDEVMIINLGGISYEICPRYPDMDEIPLLWENLTGEYDLIARLPSGVTGNRILGNAIIQLEDGVLQMGGRVGPILPISETEIIILSGSFAGETMLLEPETGNIYHQGVVFVKR